MLRKVSMIFGKECDPVSGNGIKIDFKSVLGMGSNTVIYKCKRRNEELAIKRIRLMDEECYEIIVRERDIWQQLDHQNIVKLLRHFEANKDYDGVRVIYHVMELCESDLSKWFRINQYRKLLECETMINEIISGLSYLHSNNIMHRDLKPQNILITFDGICKLADFGLVKKHDKTKTKGHTNAIGTELYAAPELRLRDNSESVVSEGASKQIENAINEYKTLGSIPENFFHNFDKITILDYVAIKNLIVNMIKSDPLLRPDLSEVKLCFRNGIIKHEDINDAFVTENENNWQSFVSYINKNVKKLKMKKSVYKKDEKAGKMFYPFSAQIYSQICNEISKKHIDDEKACDLKEKQHEDYMKNLGVLKQSAFRRIPSVKTFRSVRPPPPPRISSFKRTSDKPIKVTMNNVTSNS